MALFTTTNYPVNALIEDIDLGKIGLPELQRPFVWHNVYVRDLFDSIYRGYPAGFLLFWETGADTDLKGIGTKNANAIPKLDAEPVVISVAELIAAGESDAVEFKATLRTNLHTGEVDEKMHLAVLRTIAGFLNAKGGTLLIGIANDGVAVGLSSDKFASEDKMGLHLVNLVRDRIGDVFLPYVHAHFDEKDGHRVLAVRCEKGPKAAFVKDGSSQRFFVRGGNATSELSGASVTDYVKQRFG